jgi:hypothetical protein
MCKQKGKQITLLLIIAAIAVCLAVTATALPSPPNSAVQVYTEYQSINQGSWTPMTGAGTVSGTAVSSPDGSTENQSYAKGLVDFSTSFAGKLGSISTISGSYPGFDPPYSLYASSDSYTDSHWTVVSNTLAVGTPVDLVLNAHFDGSLYTGEWFGGGPSSVYANASAHWDYYKDNSFGEHFSGGISLDDYYGVSQSGDWDTYGSWTSSLGTREIFVSGSVDAPWTIHMTVGEGVRLYMGLSTNCGAVSPSEVKASSDFLNTGYISVTGLFDPTTGNRVDATLRGNAVPEPATILGFGVPMLMIGLGKLRRLRK